MDYTRKKVRKTSVMEHIITFLPGQLPGEEVFGIEMTGITYPDSHYHIVRENSLIYCLEYVMEGTGVVQIGEEIYHPKKETYISWHQGNIRTIGRIPDTRGRKSG